MKKNKQLGQGLGALLTPSKQKIEDFSQSSILLSKINPNPNQPRKNFENKSLKQLAQSIEEKGLISPITVKKVNSKYIIVAGERRFRAHKLLNKKRILAYVIDADASKDIMYMALIENIQREDLNPIEEAKGYKYLQDNLQSSITEIAKTVGKSRPAVSNALRLLKLPDEIQESILKGEINAGQARAILQSKTTQGMMLLWKKLLTEKISVRKTEKLASHKKVSPQLQSIQNQLSRLIGERVVINQNTKTKKGFVKISFDKKTVDRVFDKLKSIKSD
jgi:ParB family chromosome partitioning protein|tara:strand:+ start:2760 stop:3590 length:831 start_codon:yes stop_codon:yes gene_type:complete